MLEVQDVTIRFGGNTPAVDNVSIAVKPGEIVSLCGPNGAGKSTLLSVLAGDLPPQEGRAFLDGRHLHDFSPQELATRRAVLEQSPTLAAAFKVKQLAGLSIAIEISPDTVQEIVTDTLMAVGLQHRAENRADLLSGGQQHRAHLSRVLSQLSSAGVEEGRYLLLDEPTARLDLTHQVTAMRVARKAAQQGVGVLVVLHDLNLAAAFSDRVALMHEGKLVAEGTAEKVFTGDRLSEVYEAPLQVDRGPSNTVRVSPIFFADSG
ncbi:MAG: heme ABC transporter ATP-binding protein [Alphaproteobacteria bacterium]|nr:heme ABC transporter ATP-binding protein [Alphaproteobacteria bacterium]